MNFIYSIYSQLKELSVMSVRMLQATLVIFCLILICVLILLFFPEITNNHVHNEILIDELLNSSTRILTLGTMTAFLADLAIRT